MTIINRNVSTRLKQESEYFYNKAEDLLASVSKEDAISWMNSECTKALLCVLEGALVDKVFNWKDGLYLDMGNSQKTVQLSAMAQGYAQGLESAISAVLEIKNIGEDDINVK